MTDWLVRRAGRPLNIAHRGGVEMYGPDLLDAITRAVAAGADAVEVDVQTTKDEELVVFHDRLFPAPVGGHPLGELTLAEARAVGAAGTPERLPLLADVLGHARTLGIPVLIDLKSADAAEPLVAVVTRQRAQAHVAVASFHYRPLVALARRGVAFPTVATVGFARAMGDPRGFLWTIYALRFSVRAARGIKARALLCQARRVSAHLVEAAHASGLALLVWDVTPETDVHRLARWGVDGMVTKDPTTAGRQMANEGKSAIHARV